MKPSKEEVLEHFKSQQDSGSHFSHCEAEDFGGKFVSEEFIDDARWGYRASFVYDMGDWFMELSCYMTSDDHDDILEDVDEVKPVEETVIKYIRV